MKNRFVQSMYVQEIYIPTVSGTILWTLDIPQSRGFHDFPACVGLDYVPIVFNFLDVLPKTLPVSVCFESHCWLLKSTVLNGSKTCYFRLFSSRGFTPCSTIIFIYFICRNRESETISDSCARSTAASSSSTQHRSHRGGRGGRPRWSRAGEASPGGFHHRRDIARNRKYCERSQTIYYHGYQKSILYIYIYYII